EAMEVDDQIILHFEYCTALFSRNTIERLTGHFVNILENLVHHPHMRISEIELLSAKEKLQILEEFNTAFSEPIRNETFIEGFEKQVKNTPDRVALIGQMHLTYRELKEKSTRLACLLREKGVEADVIVGIMVERTVEMIIGILGILKAGGAYMPIDPEYPEERVNYMLADSNVGILLSGVSEVSKVSKGIELVSLSELNEEFPTHLTHLIHPTHLCYIIYTSGSTGKPKGVMVNHKNLVSYLDSFEREFKITVDDVVLQQASYSFDAFVEEVFPCLLKGGKIALPSRDRVRDTALLVDFISANKISMIDCSPLLLSELNRSCPVNAPGVPLGQNPLHTVHTFISGGDVLKSEYIGNLIKTGVVYNTYGPTETTVCASYHKLSGEEQSKIPIGKPITNYRVYILNRAHRCLPIGVPGELCISGLGVTRGYLNQPELTAEKFDHDLWDYQDYHDEKKATLEEQLPGQHLTNLNKKFLRGGPGGAVFSKSAPPGRRRQKIYKTGDLGRWLSDGSIEFLGRIDRQVNIRGFRIELEEIERQLQTHEDIHETAVTAIGASSICAYFTAGKEKNPKELRRFLSLKLPDYMIPAYFVQLDQLPLTPRGKIDTRTLPEPGKQRFTGRTGYKAPGSELEKKLADIWQELLGLEGIGIEDDFFELGGDSLLANQCIARIREELEIELSLRKFFENPCIESLVKVSEPGEVGVPRLRPMPKEGKIPLSFSQERLWFLQCLDPGSMAYYVPRVIRIKGEPDIELVERVITEIIRRHEILRTVFPTTDGEAVQRIREPYAFQLPIIDFSGLSEEEQGKKVSQWLEEEGQRGFNFQDGPMMRITLLKVKEKEYILVLTEHHLIHDGWTQEVLLKEFIILFTAYSQGKPSPLAELPIQYADFAIWQRNHLKGEVLERHLDYWKNKLSGLAPVLELPADRPRPAVISGKGAMKDIRLSRELSDSLRKYSKERGTTLFMTMLAVFKVLVYRYTGCEDICVGTGAANRKHKELEGMLGMLINTLALRTFVTGDLSFEACRERVKTTCMEAYEHEDTPFEKVVEVIRPERSLSYTPIFQVIFSFMDIRGVEIVLPGLELQAEVSHNRSSKFDINVVVVPPLERTPGNENEPGEILIEWEYSTDLFDAETIDRMIGHYNRLLEEIIRRPTVPIAVLPMLAQEEIERLLYAFNDTRTGYPGNMPIHSLFELQAEKTPDYIALHGEGHITYGELNDKSDRLAHLLREKGVQPDTIVGMMMKHSIEMIAGMMGILKAGGAYLPIDPEYPEDRIDYMLTDSNARILVSEVSEVSKVSEGTEIVNLSELSEEFPTHLTHLT
ncbi:MAG: amino acid adenylation domain-containing protein, partial [Candidatus Aminicenantes bacterium]|nr:amino acid adenylation domain-containing protein [Candidatus Aminicenantes bacterium]NIM84265.1 amino acid adenylation domain-containing protein [Candidatus Aminicenantes bacterium]NIN18219.1 amino acid adenylation domain-containing protein [Candidatus Aminicenantes bacterium]NIN42116.1 amino acid adenylation domain-containing protein [Candidatus Aminicenantes bacterium]NIN90394.1 amino acid adenylation domain-containing protein [Candidatus Aminicenantes bacterium]